MKSYQKKGEKAESAYPEFACRQAVRTRSTTSGSSTNMVSFRKTVSVLTSTRIWGFDLDQFQVYARFILLDGFTGYRSQYQELLL